MTAHRTWSKTSQPGIYRRGQLYRFRAPGAKSWTVTSSMAEARRLKAKAVVAGRRPTADTTFSEYATRWLRDYRGRTATGVSDATRESYGRGIALAVERFGNTRLERVDAPALKALVGALVERGLEPASIRRYMAPVRACLADAAEAGLIAHAPSVRIVAPKSRAARPKTLTGEELERLVAATPSDQRELVAFVVNTGCRISEALGLRWRNLAVVDGAPVVRFERSKTAAGLAPIALPPATARMLTARRASAGARSDELVFPNAAGHEHDRRTWTRRVFKPAAVSAGIPWATPHMLRHSLATRLADRGETAERIARVLRHADHGRTAGQFYIRPALVDTADVEIG